MNTALMATVALAAALSSTAQAESATSSFPIVDTHLSECAGQMHRQRTCPSPGEHTFGQDAQYQGLTPSYTNHHDGTVTDNVTGLMWTQTTDLNGDGSINSRDKLTYRQALAYADTATIGGYHDWRLPDIKTLYSLILFDGQEPDAQGGNRQRTLTLRPFIDAAVFGFGPGDQNAGERLIDSQYASSTRYVATTMGNQDSIFGVNFMDGRIKGYGIGTPPPGAPHGEKTFYVMLVRNQPNYGQNQFSDNQNGTITDVATGLIWQQGDSGKPLNWPDALAYCDRLTLGGYHDWRLPNAKALQSIVDYRRSPDTTESAAIDPSFNTTPIINEAGQQDFGAYWSSTTHTNVRNQGAAVYLAFGRAMGYMHGRWLDVHGAGAQRSDPKTGNAGQYPQGRGPQGDAVRIQNLARCVRGGITRLVQQPASRQRPSLTYPAAANTASTMIQPPRRHQAATDDPLRAQPDFPTNNRQPMSFPARQGRHQPPPEAIKACVNKAPDSPCQVETPHGKLSGHCLKPTDDVLACVPSRPPTS
ncbi:DUF1566 domain-containing protein [Photobacterium sp. TY1-4]|uniref:Lcl C-terminal domain-containing protein n=1 Tax=Photobacterium sp. TY1-4 TaxID=2899122 RepID=UPI0021BE20A2|nr:DUF1566 domain-containing protein [Photobacterium sp. TY1-4]UXI03861.1 DUF1566 domain-containing protein [Photobacterium sp. TY1-4]